MKQVFLFCSLFTLSATASAERLVGRVMDGFGRPIPAAQVEIVGSSVRARTDQAGQFILDVEPERVDELHVRATGYSHQIIHLHGEQQGPLEIRLHGTVLEEIDVIGLPIHASTMRSVQAIAVLGGEELRNRQASTLGDTLKYEVGVHSSYFGPVASSPIIRGLDGPRVLITQNGLDVGDASRVGPDHVVAVEAATARQIEILRGPATLFYGTGAIGGVVNVVDDRVPEDKRTRGAFLLGHNSLAGEDEASVSYTSGLGQFAYHIDGFWRDGDDYRIPGAQGGHDGRLENSASQSQGFNLGGSWLLDNGYIGLSYGRLDRLNGVPGHGHAESDHQEEEPHEEAIYSELKQDRWQLLSELDLDGRVLAAINTRMGFSEYRHAEIHAEDDAELHLGHEHEADTVFVNRTLQARVDLEHQEFARWHGALSLEFKQQEFEAMGEEAFTPPSTTQRLGVALVEERHAGNFLWQLGARIESVRMDADPFAADLHLHDEQGQEVEAGQYLVFDRVAFNPFSLSAGFVWDFRPAYKLALSLSHAERAPSAAEVFSLGPHIGARSFEVGALFSIDEESPGAYFFEMDGGSIGKETSNNIDLSLRRHEGDLGFVLNAFYNRVSDYYYPQATGLTTEDLFGHEVDAEDDHGGHDHAGVLPVFMFEQADASFYGLEAELAWQMATPLKWTLWGDAIRGRLGGGGNLPRIPPLRLGSQLSYSHGAWFAELSAVRYFDQNRVAEFETPTAGYTLVDAHLSYTFELSGLALSLFAKGVNLGNQEARVHSSFLKDLAPLPGRGFSVGLRGEF